MTEKVYSVEFQEVEKDSFCLDIINKAKELGFSYIFEPVNYKGVEYDSTKLSADFNLALRAGQAGLIKEARKYARSHKKFDKDWPGLIRTDLFTELAARFNLKGMYKKRDASPEEQEDYQKFSDFWSEHKAKYFMSYVQEEWKSRPRKIWKPVAAVAAGLAALVAGSFASYEFYFKPDIKREIQQSIPAIDIDSTFERLKPELKKEIQQSLPNLDEIYSKFVDKIKPELKTVLDSFKEDIKKEAVEIYRAEAKAYNDNMEAGIEEAIERVMKKKGLDELLRMLRGND